MGDSLKIAYITAKFVIAHVYDNNLIHGKTMEPRLRTIACKGLIHHTNAILGKTSKDTH